MADGRCVGLFRLGKQFLEPQFIRYPLLKGTNKNPPNGKKEHHRLKSDFLIFFDGDMLVPRRVMVNGWFRARWFGFLGSPRMKGIVT